MHIARVGFESRNIHFDEVLEPQKIQDPFTKLLLTGSCCTEHQEWRRGTHVMRNVYQAEDNSIVRMTLRESINNEVKWSIKASNRL